MWVLFVCFVFGVYVDGLLFVLALIWTRVWVSCGFYLVSIRVLCCFYVGLIWVLFGVCLGFVGVSFGFLLFDSMLDFICVLYGF